MTDKNIVKEITDRDFDKEVLACELPVFACFFTRSCQYCYPTCVFADQLFEKYYGMVKFVKVDINKSPEIASRYGIVAFPAILLFQNSQLVKSALGLRQRASLRQMLGSLVGEAATPYIIGAKNSYKLVKPPISGRKTWNVYGANESPKPACPYNG